MAEQHWNLVLRLMSVMVLAENKVYPEKLSSFTANCLKLRDDIDPDIVMTSKMATEWFVSNREDIKTHLRGDHSDRYLNEVIRSLKSFQHKDKLWKVLQDIAVSDGSARPSETHILKQVRYLWARKSI